MYTIICFLQRFLRKVSIVDTDFLVYVGDLFDWDMLPFFDPALRFPVPLFVQEKTKTSKTFLIYPRSFDGFNEAIRESSSVPGWNRRWKSAIWRGSTTGGGLENSTRAKLVRMSLAHPDLIDARFTHCSLDSITCEEMHRCGMMGESMSYSQQLLFRMVVMVDGNSLPDRFAHQMAMGHVILKQDSPHEEFWYRDAKEWIHYIPVAKDLSNLADRIKQVANNETLLTSIGTAGRDFIRQKMSPPSIDCLWADLLQTYSRHMTQPVSQVHGSIASYSFCRPPMT